MTYINYICNAVKQTETGSPIYTHRIADMLADEYNMENREASAATSVAIKRIIDGKLIPELRFYQKGIYYLTEATPFGEVGINKEQLIADKYIDPDNGYETGLTLLHNMGLTSQIPRERVIASNVAKECVRTDIRLGVTIRPPKTWITADNKQYLQTLDAIELMNKAPIDAEHPYRVIAGFIKKQKLSYERLLNLADHYYTKNTILNLAHTASNGGDMHEASFR